jgi:hypothetical protein
MPQANTAQILLDPYCFQSITNGGEWMNEAAHENAHKDTDNFLSR